MIWKIWMPFLPLLPLLLPVIWLAFLRCFSQSMIVYLEGDPEIRLFFPLLEFFEVILGVYFRLFLAVVDLVLLVE